MKYRAAGFIAFFTLYTLYVILPTPAFAHAFGIQYTLPIPIELYLYGGAGAIILSFLLIGFFLNQSKMNLEFPKRTLPFSFSFPFPFKRFFSLFSLFLFLLAIATGIFGIQDSLLNFNMTFFWIIFYLGITYLSAVFGNIWSVLNPWKTLIEIMEKVRGEEFRGVLKYPGKWGYFPGLILFFSLIWLELIGKTNPFSLSIYLILYTLLSTILAFLFGKKVWIERVEFFTIFFSFISKISPLQREDKKLTLNLPFVKLVEAKITHFSLVLFILFMLSSTFYDGFHATTLWYRFEIHHLVLFEQSLGSLGYPLIQTLAMAFFLALFLGLYLLINILMKIITHSSKPVTALSLDFISSLIPIALVYNGAHYYTLLLIQGQSIIYLLSDPFGLGWNLFGTASFSPNIGLLGGRFIWNSQVFLILGGHIAAIIIAHLISLKVFPTHKKAMLSQLPMLILMVFYTMAGLWILSQPLTGGA